MALVTLNYTQILYDRMRENIFHSTARRRAPNQEADQKLTAVRRYEIA
jgi:hypothetical protein